MEATKAPTTAKDFRMHTDDMLYKFRTKKVLTEIDGDKLKSICHTQLSQTITQIKDLLTNTGIAVRQKVAVISSASVNTFALNVSLAYLGYVAVLVDETLPAKETINLLKKSDCVAIFASTEWISSNNISLDNWFIFEIKDNYVYELIKQSACFNEFSSSSEDVIAIMFSSGTTGDVKGVEIRYDAILKAVDYIKKYAGINHKCSYLNVLPLNHIAGYSASISYFLVGANIGFLKNSIAPDILNALVVYEPTDFIMIPKVFDVIKYKILLQAKQQSKRKERWFDFAFKLTTFFRKNLGLKLPHFTKSVWSKVLGHRMKIMGVGSAPCDGETISFFLGLGIDFINVYGSTETCFPITATFYDDKYACAGVGNIDRFSDIQVKILEPDENGIGEIVVKTPLIAKGYLNEEESFADAFTTDSFFKTGDLGRMDSIGNLTVVGRKKECILRENGKKVVADDVDKYYGNLYNRHLIAACGRSLDSGYDELCLYVQAVSATEQENTYQTLMHLSALAPAIYKLDKVCFVETIPMTALGKVQRHKLQNVVEYRSDSEIRTESFGEENSVFQMLHEMFPNVPLSKEMRLREEVGVDSLGFFDLAVRMEKICGRDVSNELATVITIGDLIALTQQGNTPVTNELKAFPQEKRRSTIRFANLFFKFSRSFYDFQVEGIDTTFFCDQSVILAPNHESYFDAAWVACALQENHITIDNFCCLAAKELLKKPMLRDGLIALGGIPIDRKSDSASALKRMSEVIVEKKPCICLIHPEGTRSRNGTLGEFKNGVSSLSQKTKTAVLPVCIVGAFEIFPPNRKLPRLYDWKNHRKYRLTISFGTPISPDDFSTPNEMTVAIKNQIVQMEGNINENRN